MPNPKRKPSRDIAQEITNKLIDRLEEGGPLPWRRPWQSKAMAMPLRSTGQAYSGVNHLLLSIEAHCSGYTTPYWMTYRQARDLGGCVRKGERSSMIVYYGSAPKKGEAGDTSGQGEDSEGGMYRFLKGYHVFNCDQIDDLPERFHPVEDDIDTGVQIDERIAAFFERMPFSISHGHEYAAYQDINDQIVMPDASRFESAEAHAATALHEAVHATGPKNRLDRECFHRYHENREQRAAEELIAEIGSCQMTARMGIAGEHIDNHAAYVASWIKCLRNDKRHIFKAAADAQRACDWLVEKAGTAMPSVDVPFEKAA